MIISDNSAMFGSGISFPSTADQVVISSSIISNNHATEVRRSKMKLIKVRKVHYTLMHQRMQLIQ